MTEPNPLKLEQGQIVALPFYAGEKFVVGSRRAGGMGAIYLMSPVNPIHPVLALKTYLRHSERDAFEREARVWISLGSHPNVARAFAFGSLDDVPCILAEWHDRDMTAVDPRGLCLEEIKGFASGIIAGLLYAEREVGLVHKDIKPQNVLVGAENVPKIGDFGMAAYGATATQLDSPFARTDRSKESLGGTPPFMAPELFQGSEPSIRSDIFAVGVTLFVWLTGRHPFLGPQGRVAGFLREGLSEIVTAYGDDALTLASVIQGALKLEPQYRVASYEEMLAQLGSDAAFPENQSPPPEVPGAVNTIIALRSQGRLAEAMAIAEDQLHAAPRDPILLNTYANLLRVEGRLQEAVDFLERAIAILETRERLVGGGPYLDPYFNLLLLRIVEGNFEGAAELSKLCAATLGEVAPQLRTSFAEIGWGLLYDGEFAAAGELLISFLAHKHPSDLAMKSLCLATALHGRGKDLANRGVDAILEERNLDTIVVQFICVLGSYCDAEHQQRIREKLLDAPTRKHLEAVGLRLANDASFFEIPMQPEYLSAVLRGFDSELLGRKFHGVL